MKPLKIILITVFSFCLLIYAAFIFALPVLFDINAYLPQVVQEVQEKTGITLKFKNVKTFSDWKLSAGAAAERVDFLYPDGEKFGQINDFKIAVSAPYLFLGKIKLSTLDAQKALFNLKVNNKGQFLLTKYLKSFENEGVSRQKLPFGLTFYSSVPDIKIENYRFSLINTDNSKGYFFKGKDFEVSDFVLDKKVRIKLQGSLFLDNRKQITYDICVFTKVFPEYGFKNSKIPPDFNVIKMFEDLYKYKFLAHIKSDLKINGNQKDLKIDGNLNLDDILTEIGGEVLPASKINLKFEGNKIKINSDIYTSLNDNSTISGIFENGSKKYLDLEVKSKKTDISNMFLTVNNICRIFGIKKFDQINAGGQLSADFKLKSDFKTVHSKGYLKLENAKLDYKLYNATLNSIFADIDFSQDTVNIKKAGAILNSQPIIIKGGLDKKANADILIEGKNLQLNGVLAMLGKREFLRENDVSAGIVNISTTLKGRLNNLLPEINASFDNVFIYNKPKKLKMSIQSARADSAVKGKEFKGKINVAGIKISSPNFFKSTFLPELSMNFDKKDLNIEKSSIILDNSKLDVQGKISDYNALKPFFDLKAKGFVLATDISSMMKQYKPKAVGKLPIIIKFYGSDRQKIQAQMFADKNNHVSFIDIKGLGQTSLVDCDLTLDKDVLKIEEAAVYSTKAINSLSENFKANTASGYKVLTLGGKISGITSEAKFRNIEITVPNQLTVTLPAYPHSSARFKGDLKMNGSIKNPEVGGYLSISSLSIPELQTGLKNSMIHFNQNFINAACPEVIFGSSSVSINALALNDFSQGLVVNNVDIISENLDLNDVIAFISKFPQNPEVNGAALKLTVLKGTSRLDRFKAADLISTNVTSNISLDNNIFNMDDVRGDAYLGKIAGSINYDFIQQRLGLNLQGRGLSAAVAIKALGNMKENVHGRLDFDTVITTVGQSRDRLLKTLKGGMKFVVSNGEMKTLGRLEHFLYAQNIVSNNLLKANLNLIAKVVSTKNTGVYRQMKGNVDFSGAWANISSLTTTGPSMSMYITGRYHLIDEVASLTILGRVSDDIVQVLGPLGDLSVDKIISSIIKTELSPRQSLISSGCEKIDLIPPLTPKTSLSTKTFKVSIDGKIQSQSSVKSFKWVTGAQSCRPGENPMTEENALIKKEDEQKNQKEILIPDFIDSLPDLKK